MIPSGNTRLLLLIGAFFLSILPGCGNGYKQATPTELGISIYLSIKNDDREGHRSLYVQEDDFDAFFQQVDGDDLDEEAARKEFDRDLQMLQAELDVGYSKMRARATEDGLDWETIDYKGVDVQKRERDGIKVALVRVILTSKGQDYEIDAGECARLNDRWVVGKLVQIRRLDVPWKF